MDKKILEYLEKKEKLQKYDLRKSMGAFDFIDYQRGYFNLLDIQDKENTIYISDDENTIISLYKFSRTYKKFYILEVRINDNGNEKVFEYASRKEEEFNQIIDRVKKGEIKYDERKN